MMIVNDDCIAYMKSIGENSIDSIVTDPPYNIGFMEKNWDKTGIAFDIEVWKECLRVLKPGGFLLSFSSTKNYHRLASSIEYAGFDIKDIITWNYSSGMPKGQDIAKAIESKITNGSANTQNFKNLDGVKGITSIGFNKMKKGLDVRPNNYNNQEYNKEVFLHTEEAQKWEGWKTQLKPAVELICVAQKPLSEKTFAENILKWGTGAFNIDACRILHNEPIKKTKRQARNDNTLFNNSSCGFKSENLTMASPDPKGRFPTNVILDEETAKYLDKIYGNHKSGSNCTRTKEQMFVEHKGNGNAGDVQITYGDEGGISRFYYTVKDCADRFVYCPKASKKEKNKGCENLILWKKEELDQELTQLKEQVLNLQKVDISEFTTLTQGVIKCNTSLFGKENLEKSQKVIKSIILTETQLTTIYQILCVLTRLPIRDSIRDAIKMIVETGINLAEIAEQFMKLKQVIINEKMAYLLGVSIVVLKVLQKIKDLGRKGNLHTTVKPIKLMEYLVKLVTPPNGIVLDPFMGSGTTGIACKRNGFKFIGIEKEREYYDIAERRISDDRFYR